VQPRDRAAAVGAERDRLLKEIRRRRRELAKAEHDIEDAKAELDQALGAILSEQYGVERETHALFAELLAPGKLPKSKRAHVGNLYAGLQQIGLIGPPPAGDAEFAGEPRAFPDEDGPWHAPPDPSPDTVATAQKPDDERHRTLRALFKRLVLALHPDRTRHEREKTFRTAAMKDVTRAYDERDLARMIELGERFSVEAPSTDKLDDPKLLTEALERMVAELKSELREVLDDLRAVRRSDAFRATKEIERLRRMDRDPFEAMLEEEQGILDDLVAARDFIAAFAGGKLSVAELIRGPCFPSDAAELDDIAESLGEFVAELDAEAAAPPRRRRKRGR
jgi:hypothetical protein